MARHLKAIVGIVATVAALALPAGAYAALTVPHAVNKSQVIVPTTASGSGSSNSGGGSQPTSTPAVTAAPPVHAAPPSTPPPTASSPADAPTAASADAGSDLPPVPSDPVDPASAGDIANQAGSLGVGDLPEAADDSISAWDDSVIGIDLSGPDDWTGQVHQTNPPDPDMDAAIQQAIDFANILTSGHSEPPDPLTFPNHENPDTDPNGDNTTWVCPSLNVFQIDEHIEDNFDNMGCF